MMLSHTQARLCHPGPFMAVQLFVFAQRSVCYMRSVSMHHAVALRLQYLCLPLTDLSLFYPLYVFSSVFSVIDRQIAFHLDSISVYAEEKKNNFA